MTIKKYKLHCPIKFLHLYGIARVDGGIHSKVQNTKSAVKHVF